MKTELKKEWMLWLIIIAPLILIVLKWNEFPDTIPTHWNAAGEVDDTGGKWALFLSPMINAAVYLLMIFLPKIDPRKKNYNLFSGTYFVMRSVLCVFFSMLGFVTGLEALGVKLDVALIMELSVLALFMILGNSFGKIRPNFFVGLRTPWTLSNEEVWRRTHRFAGRLWVITVLILLPCVFLLKPEIFMYVFMSGIAVMVIVPVVHSWMIHKQITGKGQA